MQGLNFANPSTTIPCPTFCLPTVVASFRIVEITYFIWGNANWGLVNRGQKGPFGGIFAASSWLWGEEELVPISPKKGPDSPWKGSNQARKGPILSENLGLKPLFVSPRFDFPNWCSCSSGVLQNEFRRNSSGRVKPLRAQILKNFKRDWNFQASLKFSSEPPTKPLFFVGNSGGQDWKFQARLTFSSEIEFFKRSWIFSRFGPLGTPPHLGHS